MSVPHVPIQESAKVQQRLGDADELQIQLLMRLSPARRMQTMLELQAAWLAGVRARLRRAHPELSDYALTRLMFERLKQNG